MSKLNDIKNKVRQSGSSSVHSQIIDTNIIEDDLKAMTAPQPQKDENVNVHVNESENPVAKRKIRKKFEETHTRQTYWIHNEYMDLIGKETAGERGEKTRIVNEALKEYFGKRKR